MDFYMKEQGVRTSFDYGQLNISGNEDYGFRPYQLMVSSIAGCSASVFRKIVEKQRMELEDWKITADVERNPEEANRIERIQLHYIVKGKNLSEEKLKKSLETARKNCSMIRSVEDSITIEESLEYIELSV
ncbi:OsmC family peroxiredoxin [Sediminibacillus dalangtanensis]|uniref:OsmC family peroxiredoxin n=1 Tax=Sediminibacillus dalangtanensis TaxID=2729421 RepID=A0ABX7VNB0_9BACI|nr:OsmC family protein [Sediminibacillus dalangtanensis]QTM98332.1 OsmC family peroxiredoxin [Sediminibacillus dalangtanensis]